MEKKKDKVSYRHYPREIAYRILHRTPYHSTISVPKSNTLFIAHRGLSGIERENTLPAFRLAGEKSYYGIETDVHKTSDGKYVIIHDDTTGRVGETDVIVERTTFENLRAIRLKDAKGAYSDAYRIPTLEEYITVCKDTGKIAVLELKNHFEEADVKEIADNIREMGYLDKTIFISFDFDNLVSLRKYFPSQPVQYLTCVYRDELLEMLKTHRMDLDIYYGELTKERIALLQKNGIKVNCWTCNSRRYAARLIRWGVDYITTNILE
jgi:glycerophosphoryl diester phosphodiesterase